MTQQDAQPQPTDAGPVDLELGPLPERRIRHVYNAAKGYECDCWTEDAVREYAAAAVAAERRQRELVFSELLKEQGEHARARYALRDLVQALDTGDSLAVAGAMSAAEGLLGPNVRANLTKGAADAA